MSKCRASSGSSHAGSATVRGPAAVFGRFTCRLPTNDTDRSTRTSPRAGSKSDRRSPISSPYRSDPKTASSQGVRCPTDRLNRQQRSRWRQLVNLAEGLGRTLRLAAPPDLLPPAQHGGPAEAGCVVPQVRPVAAADQPAPHKRGIRPHRGRTRPSASAGRGHDDALGDSAHPRSYSGDPLSSVDKRSRSASHGPALRPLRQVLADSRKEQDLSEVSQEERERVTCGVIRRSGALRPPPPSSDGDHSATTI